MAKPEDTLLLELSTGPVEIETRPDLAPAHVARIKELARKGFYDGIVFHPGDRRLHGANRRSDRHRHRRFGEEPQGRIHEEPHIRGTCSMARASSPDSADSQFFICFDEAPFLNRQYTVWGQVVSGMENVDKIKRGEPVKNPDRIVKMRVKGDPS